MKRGTRKILTLLDIPMTQLCIGQKDLEQLLKKLCSMNIAVPLAVAHLYQIQHALSQEGVPGLAVAGLSLRKHGLTGPRGANISLDHAPGQDCFFSPDNFS